MSVRRAHRYRVLDVDRTVQLIEDAHLQFVATPSPTYPFFEQNILRSCGVRFKNFLALIQNAAIKE